MLCRLVAAALLMLGCLPLSGCGAKTTSPAGDANTTAASGDSESAEIEAALAQLSPEDRQAAEKQKICPVGKGPLGTMGPPAKVNIEGRDVFLCCSHCESLLREDPKTYLANIDDQ
jgi:hypothetical protein